MNNVKRTPISQEALLSFISQLEARYAAGDLTVLNIVGQAPEGETIVDSDGRTYYTEDMLQELLEHRDEYTYATSLMALYQAATCLTPAHKTHATFVLRDAAYLAETGEWGGYLINEANELVHIDDVDDDEIAEDEEEETCAPTPIAVKYTFKCDSGDSDESGELSTNENPSDAIEKANEIFQKWKVPICLPCRPEEMTKIWEATREMMAIEGVEPELCITCIGSAKVQRKIVKAMEASPSKTSSPEALLNFIDPLLSSAIENGCASFSIGLEIYSNSRLICDSTLAEMVRGTTTGSASVH